MSRLSQTAIALLVLGGVVAAMVRAQDDGGRVSQVPGRAAPISTVSGSTEVRLVQALQDAGQSVAAEYQVAPVQAASPSLTPPGNRSAAAGPEFLLAANDGEVRSILSRRTTLDEKRSSPGPAAVDPPPAATPGQAVSPSRAPATGSDAGPAARTAAVPDRSAGSATLQPPGLLDTQRPASTAPAAPAGAAPAGDGQRVSSRRTFQTPGQVSPPAASAGVAPPLVAARPLSTSAAADEAADPVRDMLGSVTGALVRVATVGPAAFTIGATSEISFRLSNLGSTDALGVTVRVALPASFEMVSAEVEDGSTRVQPEATGSVLIWTIDQVPARAERLLTLRAIPRTATPLDLAVECSLAPVSSVARIQVHEPKLEVAVRGPSEIVYGETKVFSVAVSNPGTGEARDVTLRLSLGDESADTLQVGTVAAGGSREFDVEVTARQAGPMQIVAAADGAPALKAEAREQVQVRRAELAVETLGSGLKYAGSVGTYQVRVSNKGDAPAENVVAAVRLPAGAKYVQGLESPVQEGSNLNWTVGSLGPGQDRTYRFFCQLDSEGEARFEIAVRGEAGLEAAANVVTNVQAIADLKMIVNDPPGPVAVGQEVVYEIEVSNRGTKEATQVQVIAQFSDGIEPAKATGAQAEVVPGQVVFQPIARLDAGQTIKLTVNAKADKDGSHVFRAELRCSDPEYRLVAEDTTTFFGDDLMDSPVDTLPAASAATTNAAPEPLTNRPTNWTAK